MGRVVVLGYKKMVHTGLQYSCVKFQAIVQSVVYLEHGLKAFVIAAN